MDGRWTAVYLAGPARSPDSRPVSDSPDDARTTAVQAAPELVAAIQAYEKLVASQQAEIAFLREHLAVLVQRVPAIAEPAPDTTAEVSTPATSEGTQAVSANQGLQPPPARRPPWWAFWRWGEGSPA